ncbi:MAG: ABC transporter related-protein [Candidatus Moranbacteria bacterium GW2011_GWF1_36_4]|nr:MAG: ABC transporter related-protein [Candidatus Moranbacteria bacterium GW2011_GWF1_36_4]
MAIIEVKDLSKKYEYYKKQPGLWASVKSLFSREKLFKDAVRDISFKIEEGELVGFLGPNGAGKTTTLKMLSGILHPDGALVMGNKNQLWWDLPAMESFVLNKEIYEVSDEDFKKNLDELVELLDLKDVLDVQVRKLSLGQRMKCELVAALLHKPKVLFLDEPTLGLDVVAQKNVRDFVRKYNKLNKTTIILTSHYMEDIKELCERVIIIDKGKIIYDGKLDELIKKYAPYKKIKIIFDGEKISRDQLSEFGEVDEINSHFASLKVPREKTKEIASRILISSLPVDDILIDEMQADEVIRGIFSKEGAEV